MILNREPAVILAALQSLLLLAAGVGLQITTDQQGLIIGAAAALLALLTGGVTRSAVSSPATVARIRAQSRG